LASLAKYFRQPLWTIKIENDELDWVTFSTLGNKGGKNLSLNGMRPVGRKPSECGAETKRKDRKKTNSSENQIKKRKKMYTTKQSSSPNEFNVSLFSKLGTPMIFFPI